MKQLALLRDKKYSGRKCARAISLRGANHVVLKSSRPMLRQNQGAIKKLIRETQDRFGIRLRVFAVMSDHIHLLIHVSTRTQFANALRFLAGMIALKVAGARLWRARVWSRPIKSQRDLRNVHLYVALNPVKQRCWALPDSLYILDGVLQL